MYFFKTANSENKQYLLWQIVEHITGTREQAPRHMRASITVATRFLQCEFKLLTTLGEIMPWSGNSEQYLVTL